MSTFFQSVRDQSPELSPKLLTCRETAQTLRISERTLYTLTKRGELVCVRVIGGAKRYAIEELDRFIKLKMKAVQ